MGFLFYFVFAGNFQVQAPPPPPWAYIRRGEITQGFLCNEFGGFIFGGAYTWRGLSSEFYGMLYYSELSHSDQAEVVCQFTANSTG